MNFSYSRNLFNSFYKNIANNKNSMKYFNSKINSMKSLNFFSNKMHFSNMIILSNILLSGKIASIANGKCLSNEIISNETTLAINPIKEKLNDLNTNILNEFIQINDCKIFFNLKK